MSCGEFYGEFGGSVLAISREEVRIRLLVSDRDHRSLLRLVKDIPLMSTKLAFSTVACPEWTLEQVVDKAKAFGFAGVELRTLGGEESPLACDPALSDASKVRDLFESREIAPICLSTSYALHHRDLTRLGAATSGIIKSIKTASEIGCSAVRIYGNEVMPGENRRTVIARIAEHAKPLAEVAGEYGVQLLFENAGSFTQAKEWWWMLDIIDHPMVGICWNALNSAIYDAHDKGGWVGITTLNSRIKIAKIKDSVIGRGSGFLPIGQGTAGVENTLKRLKGIGYDGYICLEWDRAWFPSLMPAEDYLPQAKASIDGWDEVLAEKQAKAVKQAEKAAKKAAPKSRAEIQELVEKAAAKAAKKAAKAGA